MNKPIGNGLPQPGNKTPFTVPQGYFESFEERLAAKLAESRTEVSAPLSRPKRRLHLYAAAAVVVFLLAFTATFALYRIAAPGTQAALKGTPAQVMAGTDKRATVEQAVDYSMMDKDDMYAYVSGTE